MDKKINITVISVVSCIAVVFLHTNVCFWSFSRSQYWVTANVIECIFYFAVPCFFMVSGATLVEYRERYSLKDYLRKRADKVLIPYIIWSFIGLFIQVFFFSYSDYELTPISLYNGIMTNSYVGIYWFFPAIISQYLCVPVFAAIDKSLRKETFSYLVIAGFLTNTVIPFFSGFLHAVWPFSVNVVLGSLFYLVLGYLFQTYPLQKKTRIIIYSVGVVGFFIHLIGTYIESMEIGSVSEIYKGYFNLPCVLYSSGVFLWFRYNSEKLTKLRIINKGIDLIAPYTFGIFLIHWFLCQGMLRIFKINIRSLSYRLGAPFIVIPLSIGIIWILRQIPIVRRIVP